MINARNADVDIEEMRLWAASYREQSDPPLSWARFGEVCGIPSGTLGPWVQGKYQGDNQKYARLMLQFRQQVEAEQDLGQSLPTNPGYFETETSQAVERLLMIAHSGRITMGGLGPGTGKTFTASEYRQKSSNVWIATMKPSTKRLIQMMMEVHVAIGLEPRYMLAAEASRIVTQKIAKRKGLLVIDEANHLTIDAIEEIRSWHDETGVGVCLLGNQELIRRVESGRHKEQFARLNSRIAYKLEQDVPGEEDVRAFCDAWGISDHAIRGYLKRIALSPDAGGLRECKQLIEVGSMLAASDDRGLRLDDLREAQAGRASKWIRA